MTMPEDDVDAPVRRPGPYDAPPRVRSEPPGPARPPRSDRPAAPMLRRSPLPAPADAFPRSPELEPPVLETPGPPDTVLPDTVPPNTVPPNTGLDEIDDDLRLLGFDPPPAPATSGRFSRVEPRVSPDLRAVRTAPTRPPRARPLPQPTQAHRGRSRSPWLALPGLLVLLIAATFLSWVSAEPIWLAVGHGEAGTVRVVAAGAAAPTTQCQGTFHAASGAFAVSSVDVAGLPSCAANSVHPARMASAHARDAYVDGSRGLVVRALTGVVILLACGLAIAWIGGAFLLAGRRRLVATLAGLGAPLVLLAGFLALAY